MIPYAELDGKWGHVTTAILKFGIVIGLDVLMAALSYRYFERPFLAMKNRHAVIGSQSVLARV